MQKNFEDCLVSSTTVYLNMIDSKQILSYLSANKNRFKQDYNLIKIGLFGSMIRNQQTNLSDIDLIVEFEDNTPDLSAKKQELKKELQSKFKVNVDICREKYIKPIFKQQITSEAQYV